MGLDTANVLLLVDVVVKFAFKFRLLSFRDVVWVKKVEAQKIWFLLFEEEVKVVK